jgi:hypothetical protein
VHDRWQREFVKLNLNASDVVEHQSQWHICGPGYKEEYGKGDGGWAVERGMPPKPKGGHWIRFYYEAKGIKSEIITAN